MRKKLDYDYCSASPILEWLGDKWALVVLLKLHENGVIRFNELYKTIPSISEKMLSTVLRSLVTDGLVGRKIYPSVPPKVEYYVSEFGETLIPHLEQLKQWGQENFETIMENLVQGASIYLYIYSLHLALTLECLFSTVCIIQK